MPTWLATLLVGCVTVAANALLTAYYYGRLSERVEGHRQTLKRHEEENEDREERINTLRENMGKVKGKLGMNGT
jgi:hypothetical protein